MKGIEDVYVLKKYRSLVKDAYVAGKVIKKLPNNVLVIDVISKHNYQTGRCNDGEYIVDPPSDMFIIFRFKTYEELVAKLL